MYAQKLSAAQQLFVLDEFDIVKILDELVRIGATSIKVLTDEFRMVLLQEAEGYVYEVEDEVVGSGDSTVHQHMSSCSNFSNESNYYLLRNAFHALLDAALAKLDVYPFTTRLNLNALVLQKYEQGSLGITPHRDQLSYINLVCVFMIEGQGRFCLCADRSGNDSHAIDATPGRVIFMRAPGLLGATKRPFHYVTDIQAPRYTFGVRQHRDRA
ncbi:MAG: hypothetical protein M3380_04700 [Chloroflexota bacterium]|nr:hypothetical protein [Chloroflexota bacterium]